jgi:diguanylate cyclase (GGDEF)-like protein
VPSHRSRAARLALAIGARDADRPLRALAIASVLTFVSAALLVMGMVWWSAQRADWATKDRLSQTVAYALKERAAKIPYDQESVALWNEAVVNTRNAFNEKWVDVNLGVWMYDYFKHDRVNILDAQDGVVYSMADGKQVRVVDRFPNEVVARLAAQLRKSIAAGALDIYDAGKSRIPRAEDVGIVDGRPAVVSVMPLVPHSAEITQVRGTEFLIASVRFLDSSFVADLADAYLLDGVRFSSAGDVASNEQSYPLTTRSGEVIGSFVWKPKLPGTSILWEVLPVLASGLIGIGLAIAFLIQRLRKTYTELVVSEAQAKHLAFHDTLTGLPNRAFLNDRLEEALGDVRSGRSQLALMFLDLDRFKQVNDTLGHAAGDALICDLTAHLKATLKPGDVLARMGGDEFAIVVRDIKGRLEVEALCREILTVVARPFDILGGQAVVGISIGVAVAPAAGVDRFELARKADIALYQAKRSGGLNFEFFTEDMNQTAQQRRDLEIDLRSALASGNEIEVVFQPMFSAPQLELTGVEALLRWHHPRIGVVSPYTFISVAEDCGLIDRLGDLVLRRACAVAGAWDLATISVNVSAIQLRRGDFAERVLDTLYELGMDANRLEIEITESTLLGSSDASAGNLKALRAAGVRVSLDDFGTGFSSLSYLMRLEVDRIKIDRSFVRHVGESAQSNSIVQAIVTMAHAVGVTVVAEGVETHAQQDFLIGIGCDHLQGYLLSPPLSALRMVEIIASNRQGPADSGIEAA